MKRAFTAFEACLFLVIVVAFAADHGDLNAYKLMEKIDELPFTHTIIAFKDSLHKDTINTTRIKIDDEGLKRYELVEYGGNFPYAIKTYYVKSGNPFSQITASPLGFIQDSLFYAIDEKEHLLRGTHYYDINDELKAVESCSYQYEFNPIGEIQKLVIETSNTFMRMGFANEIYYQNGKEVTGSFFSRGKKLHEAHFDYLNDKLYKMTVETFPVSLARDYMASDPTINITYYDKYENIEIEESFKRESGQKILQSQKVITWKAKYLPVKETFEDFKTGKKETIYYQVTNIKQ